MRLILSHRSPLAAFTASVLALVSVLTSTPAAAVTPSGNATLTSDYVWRGSTQTQGDPAVQADFKVTGDNGVYASVWGSDVEFAPGTGANEELDFVVGWGKTFHDGWALDVNLLRYQYPATTVDLNWTELNGTITYRSNYWLSVGYSNEALGYDKTGVYTLVGAKFPVNDRFRVEGSLAHYFLSKDVVAENGYTHGFVSAIWTIKAPAPDKHVEARLTAHATDSNAKHIFGDDYAGSRIEAALQASF